MLLSLRIRQQCDAAVAHEEVKACTIVYLQDNKTNSIRSFISTDDGSYRFGQLSPDTDYQVWARYKNEKSETKPISSYDSRKQVTIDLHFKTK